MVGPITVDCAQCGGRFTAKRHTAKYCSPRCRMRASRAPEVELPPARLNTTPVMALPVRAASEVGLLSVTRSALVDADRLETPMGQATILIATMLDSGLQDTGSSIAALIRQFDASLSKALEGANSVEDPVDSLTARAAARKAARSA